MSLSRKFLRELLESEEGQKRISDIWDEVTTKRTQSVWVEDREVKFDRDGTKSVKIRKQPRDVEVYALKDVLTFLNVALSFGVGKPPEDKNVNINVTARRLQDASDDELTAIVEGRVLEEVAE